MKFSKIAVLGAVLLMSAPFALADTITITGTEGGSGITTTGFTMVNNGTGPNTNQSVGAIGSTHTGVFSIFTTGGTGYYPFTKIGGGTAYNNTPAFKYASGAGGTTYPFLLFTETQSTNTLNIFVTSVTTVTVGTGNASTGTAASLLLAGYETINSGTQTPVTILITNNVKGTGAQAFTATISTIPPAPEPASLMLLGTGMLSTAGMYLRKRRSNA